MNSPSSPGLVSGVYSQTESFVIVKEKYKKNRWIEIRNKLLNKKIDAGKMAAEDVKVAEKSMGQFNLVFENLINCPEDKAKHSEPVRLYTNKFL